MQNISAPPPTKPPNWIPNDEEPTDFIYTKINCGVYKTYRYHWNSPCARLNKMAGWSLGHKLYEVTPAGQVICQPADMLEVNYVLNRLV